MWIGDGRTIGISAHSWLSHSPIFLNGAQDSLRVCDLINGSTRRWDRGKVFATFHQRTRDEIMAFPLTNLNLLDTMFWKENKAQRFSVRTAYQVALRLQNQNRVEHSSAQMHRPTWNKLWTLNVPLKFVLSFGEQARTVYQSVTIYIGSVSRWKPDVNYVVNILRLRATFCGPVLLQEMCKAWLGVESRSAATKQRISSYSSSK